MLLHRTICKKIKKRFIKNARTSSWSFATPVTNTSEIKSEFEPNAKDAPATRKVKQLDKHLTGNLRNGASAIWKQNVKSAAKETNPKSTPFSRGIRRGSRTNECVFSGSWNHLASSPPASGTRPSNRRHNICVSPIKELNNLFIII